MKEVQHNVHYVKVHIVQGVSQQLIKKLTIMMEDEMWNFELMVYLSALLDQEVERFEILKYGEVEITDPLLKDALPKGAKVFHCCFQISLKEEPEEGPKDFEFHYILVKEADHGCHSLQKEPDF